MIVFRLSKGAFCKDLSGRGAELAGGRWNSRGVAMLYTSESIALCTVEVAVHMPLGIIPSDYHLASISIPSTCRVKEVKPEELPTNWKLLPHPSSTQEVGDAFVREAQTLVLKVPSATVQGNFNYLVNPRHQDFHKIKLVSTQPFEFDKRLFLKD